MKVLKSRFSVILSNFADITVKTHSNVLVLDINLLKIKHFDLYFVREGIIN